MNYRRNALLAGIASLALVAGAGLAQAQEKEKAPAPEAKPPAAAAAPANKAPMAAEQPKGGAPNQRAEEMNRPKAMEKTAEPKAGMEGAKSAQKAEENERMKEPAQRTEEKERTKQPQRAEENERTKQTQQRAEENERNNKAATEENRSAQSKQSGTMQSGENAHNKAAAANVKLTTDQRTRIKNIVLAGHGGPRVTHVNFDVRVGTVVPRGSVEYVPVPETLVAIEPAWAGFYYFVYGEEVVIIDPDTLAIVAVVEV